MADKDISKSRKHAMLLKCHDCMGQYRDGMKDCGVTVCPLYQWMPYRKMEPDTDVFNYSPKRRGYVTLEDASRDMTDEQRDAAAERLRKARSNG